jgi:ribosomal protein S27AE
MKCPNCGTTKIFRNGHRYTNGKKIQRWLCSRCGYRFSKHTNTPPPTFYPSQGGINLAILMEKGEKPALAGDIAEKIVQFLWWMKKQGYAESTIMRRVKVLEVLCKRGANLYDPESVKEVISRQGWSENGKDVVVRAYSCFLKMIGGSWSPPIIREVEKLPFIPTEQELDSRSSWQASRFPSTPQGNRYESW